MDEVNHISFDVWQTLVTPNPKFAIERDKYLGMLGNYKNAQPPYRKLKTFLDMKNADGFYIDPYPKLKEIFEINLPAFIIKRDFEAMMWDNPPIINYNTLGAIARIRNAGKISVSIASNTNFSSGVFFRKFFTANAAEFDFYLFSDELGYPKPNPKFFKNIVEQAHGIPAKNILHIGDSNVFDYTPAKLAGMQANILDHPDTLATILSHYF